MDVTELAGEYALKADEELLLLAAAAKDLTPEAQAALADELARRGIQPVPQPGTQLPQPATKSVVTEERPAKGRRHTSFPWQVLWFVVHLILIYLAVTLITPRLGYLTRQILLGLFPHQVTATRFEFMFSHLLIFSLIPTFVAGLLMSRWNEKAAMFVWLLPAAILAIKLLSFPRATGSVFGPQPSHWRHVFHYYFGGGFVVPDFHDWQEFWSDVLTTPDYARGMAQMTYSSPFYAGAAYSLAAFVAVRSRLHAAIDAVFQSPKAPWV